MTTEERSDLTDSTIKMIDRVIKKLTALRDTLAKGKIYGAFDNVYDSIQDLDIVRLRVSSLSAQPPSTEAPRKPKPEEKAAPVAQPPQE